MDTSAAVWLALLCLVLAANLPYVSARRLLVGPRQDPKSTAWLMLELLLLGGLCLVIGRVLEARIGQVHPQGWEFYAALLCLYLTLGFPGFVWRFLRKRRTA